ncbi:hypothetical protein [Prauserella halophila]|uniref:hypothetical protein n=1 Tax=Prauserella halophila TaxID=185641 RepID=UPI0020A5FAB7|nr:hypothetical protein [Prauserella halophila]
MQSSPDMIEARRALEAALDDVASDIRASEELLSQVDDEDAGRTDEEIDLFVSYVTGAGNTPEWGAVATRVASGEITWSSVADGSLARDPGVVEAFRSNPRVSAPEQLDVIAGQVSGLDGDDSSESGGVDDSDRKVAPVDDDDYFDSSPWFA